MKKVELSLAEIPFPNTGSIERQFLADCAGNPESLPDFTAIVDETMFTSEERVYIWKTIVWMFNTGQTVDLVTLSARTGNFFINEVITRGFDASTPYTAIQHAVQLRACAIRRRAYMSAMNLIQAVTKPEAGELDVFEHAQKLVMDVQGENPIVAEADMQSVLKTIDAEIKVNKENTDSGKRTRVPTGFGKLDFLTYGGFGAGQLIILAARPSVGKTAIMLQMAKSAAKAGFPATIFSLEMTKEELGKRLLFSTGKVKPIEIATGYVNEYGYEPAKEELQNLPIYVNDESRTLAGLLSRIIVSVSQGRCKIAFVDYLGLINIDETGRMPIKDQLAKATKELKNLAKRQKIPIVALAQLNREAAKEDGAPELYHLKDSGAIEQDADIVLMLENAKRIDEDVQQRPNINIWVRKNRQYRRDIKITVEPNDSYSAFAEVDENGTPATPVEEEPEKEQQEEDKELF